MVRREHRKRKKSHNDSSVIIITCFTLHNENLNILMKKRITKLIGKDWKSTMTSEIF